MRNIEEDFGLKVINDCHSKSNVYGFILYSEENYNVIKAMRDVDFIYALNVISGPNWPIFYVSPLQKKIDEILRGGPQGTIGFTRCVSRETKYNNSALEFFGLNDSKTDLPCFVVFSVNSDKTTIDQRAFKIHGKTEDDIKLSIESIVRTIADMENTIRSGSKDVMTSPYAYWEATNKLEQIEVGNMLRRTLPGVGAIIAFVASISRLLTTQ